MFLKHNLYGLLWALVIMILCGIPGSDLPHSDFLELLNFDKFVHASIFFVLVILLINGFGRQSSFALLRESPMITAFVLAAAYGGIIEILQGAIFEERTADVFDFIANSFGACVGLLLYRQVYRHLLSRIKIFR